MQAITFNKYDGISSLMLKNIDVPAPKNDEVLVKVHCSSVNSWDYDYIIGKPRIYRLLFGLFKPKYPIPGIDIAGVVEAVGADVTRLNVGDEVFGDISGSGFGAFAEYACAKEEYLAIKPKQMSFQEASVLPHAGVLALQSMYKFKHLQPGMQMLINGAGGCVGPYLIQMAKQKGAIVTVVDTEAKFDMLRTLGADHFIDYKKEDFTRSGKKYDFIVELLAYRSIFAYKKCLKDHGVYTVVGGKPRRLIQTAIFGPLITKITGKRMCIMAQYPHYKHLNTLSEMYVSGQLKTQINHTFELSEVGKAVKMIGEGKLLGKAVIRIV